MSTIGIRPHLLSEVYEQVFKHTFSISFYLDDMFGERNKGYYYQNSSDSDSHQSYWDSFHEEQTYARVSANRLLKKALANKVAFVTLLRFIKANFTLRFRKREFYLHHNDPSPIFNRKLAFDSKRANHKFIKPFIKFVTAVSFYKVSHGTTDEAVDKFVKHLEFLTDLRYIVMSEDHGINNDVFPKLANVFARLTDFDVDADTFVTLLETTDISFPKLTHLKLTGKFENLDKIATTSDRFPLIEDVHIAPEKFEHKSKGWLFAEKPFPTVKSLTFSIEESDDEGFAESDFELIKSWFKKFPLLTNAKVTIKRWGLQSDPGDSPDRYIRLHNAFKSTDFGVRLDLKFEVRGDTDWPEEGDLEARFACFGYMDIYKFGTFIHRDYMPSKKFKHVIVLELDY